MVKNTLYIFYEHGGLNMILNDIKKWIVKQDYWQQIIAEKLLKEIPITNKDIEGLYQIFKKEKGLSDGKLQRKIIEFPTYESETEKTKNIKWKGLTNTIGVNAIKNAEDFPVGNQVTLVYGENGSGKSSYTRLFNNIFVSRGDKTLLPNLHAKKSEESTATVIFENEDGFREEVSYPEDKLHAYNKRISVFDSQSAMHDLTKESELSFAPIEFKFFDEFLGIIGRINQLLEEEIIEADIENNFTNHFDKETMIKNFIDDLGDQTSIELFKNRIDITSEDIDAHSEKLNRLKELQALNLKEKRESFQNLIYNLQAIKKKVLELNKIFSEKKITEVNKLIIERNTYYEISENEGLIQFQEDNIFNLGTEEWKDFIKAAHRYYQTFNEDMDYCILCHQDSSEVNLLDKYWKYLKSQSEINLNTKNLEINKEVRNLIDTDCSLFIKESKIDDWLQEYQPVLHKELIISETRFDKLRNEIINALETYKWKNDISSYESQLENIEVAIEDLEKEKLSLRSEEIEREIKTLQAYVDEYTDKLRAEKLLPDIERFIINRKWVKIGRECKINTGFITRFQNNLFTQYVTNQYIKQFNKECKKLDAEFSAEVKQRGRKGTTLRKLTIKERSPIEVLSEGEQRSIALANFLAETSIHNNNICTIFDDPVSSLDYKRRSKIANRLIEESQKKQIVILTHDLTFLLELQDICNKKQIEYLPVTLRKIENTVGIISESLPWIGLPVKRRISHLRNELQKLQSKFKKITSDNIDDLALYEDDAKLWCEKLRETWERSVEELLFNDSVQRFNPAIQTQRLRKVPFTTELYLEVEEGMSKCSNWVHDRAAGLGEEVPAPNTLEEYLNDSENFRKKVIKLID